MNKQTYGIMIEADNEIVDALVGKKILKVMKTREGTYDDGSPRRLEGGLTFILQDLTTGKEHKVILGYTELGEWLEYKGKI